MTLFRKTEKLSYLKLLSIFVIFGFSVTSVLAAPPNLVDQEFYSTICSFPDVRQIQVVASDNENNPITFELISGPGSIDSNTGIITYTANSSGLETFVVTATDIEGATQATISEQLTQNSSPSVSGMQDSSYYLCSPQTVYVPVTITDPDNNIESITFNNGYYDSQTSILEFIPFDSGWFEIIVTATDSCGEISSDTANIHISNDNSLLFEVPNDTTHFICETGTYYFPITYSGAPEGTSITVDGINAWYDTDSNAVAFASDCGIVNDITVTVETPCWTYVKTFTVTIICNSAPFVALPTDFTTSACIGGEVCIPVGISDINDNVSEVVTNLAGGISYNPKFHTACFTADTLGLYTVEITVIDDCGASNTDVVNVNVVANTPPVLTYTPDVISFRQCVFEEICLPVGVTDIDGNLESVTSSVGYYNYNSNEFCFTPDTAGLYSIVVTAVDSCGDFDEIIIDLTIEQGEYVDVAIQDNIFDLCGPQMVCIPVTLSGGYDSINVNLGTFANNEICFMADTAGFYSLNIDAFAECNSMSSSAMVEVRIEPRLVCPADLDTLLCEATTLAFDYQISDLVDSVKVTAPAYLENGQVMVPVLSDNIYDITMSAYSECGIDECNFVVDAIINKAPVLVAGNDFEVRVCSFREVCLDPFTLFDADNNIDSVTTNYGTIENNSVCFTPNLLGEYEVIITAYDACGAIGSDTVIVTTVLANYVRVLCNDTSLSLCDPGQTVSIPFDVAGIFDSVLVNYGNYNNGIVDFIADTAGIYSIEVTGYAECNISSCLSSVEIKIDPILSCPTIPLENFLCGPDTLVYDFQISDLVDSVIVSSPAYIIGQQVYVPVLQSGNVNVTITAYSMCGIETCNISINSIFNSAPFVLLGDDIEIPRCTVITEQFGFTFSDIDDNIDSVVTSPNVDSVVGNFYFIKPDDFGIEEIIFTVYDACGEVSIDTTVITFIQEGFADIAPFPGPVFDTICFADSIKIENFVITPKDAFITIWPNGSYDTLTQTLSIYITDEGVYPVKVRAETPCAKDSIEFELNVQIPVAPVLSCPQPFDTLVCVDTLNRICVPVEITGTDVVLSISNGAVYENGDICFTVDTAGLYDFEVIGSNYCATDTCHIYVDVIDDEAPQLFLPDAIFIERCPQDTSQICIDGIMSTDSRSQSFLSLDCGPGTLELFSDDSGQVCFWPDDFGTYNFCISTTDGCKETVDTLVVVIQEKDDCDVCVRLIIDGGVCATVGTAHNVKIKVETNDYITGFDLLLEYDVSVMSFQSAIADNGVVGGWEYFTFRLGLDDCGLSCPPGLVRLIGIADKEAFAGTPPFSSLKPEGTLIDVSFRIANDQNLNGQFLPINFYWYYCNNNTFTSLNSDSTYFENRIYNPEGVLIWDEEDDVNYPEIDRIFGLGSTDGCMSDGSLLLPRRCAEFYNGGICVVAANEQSDRGDVNLNLVPYEIADVVVFSNYFVKGLSVFTVDVIRQVAATDVNADGLTLTVSDLVTMVRIIIGDADPIPKMLPDASDIQILESNNNGVKKISTISNGNIGAALFKYDIIGDLDIMNPRVSTDAGDMQIIHNVVDNQLLVLVYNFKMSKIEAGEKDIIEIPTNGDGSLEFNSAEIVDYQGLPYKTVYKGTVLPSEFALRQNYPNPFNPLTNISFDLPKATSWNLSIYNITGALVKNFEGDSDAGVVSIEWDGLNSSGSRVASGIYLYRLNAGEYVNSKKMLLIK